jgi:tripartite-type tricarboxylate transporter receptor subunit TctC
MGTAALALATAPAPAGAAGADSYPDRPITLVLAYPPGGGTDFVARLLARQLDAILHANVVVENRPGGGSVIGTSVVARAAPDGYTLLLADPAYATSFSLMSHVPYTYDSLVPVATVTVSPLALAVPQSSPVKSLAELIAAGSKAGADLTYASAGLGSSPHLAGELLKLESGGHFTHVPYKGSGPSMQDLIAGRIDFAFATLPAAMQYIRKGQLRGLATTGEARSPLLPDLPAVAEQVPGFSVHFYTLLMAPRGTPAAIVEKLNGAVKTAMQSPAMVDGLRNAGENPSYMPQPQSAAFLKGEYDKWSKVIGEGHIHID